MRIYRSGTGWLMDCTTKVGSSEVAITITPDRHHLALWFELHPEYDPTSSVYHDMHCMRCVVCRECVDCNLRPCPANDGRHIPTQRGIVLHHKEKP